MWEAAARFIAWRRSRDQVGGQSELDEYGYNKPVLTLAEIGIETGNNRGRVPSVAAERCDPSVTSEVGNVGGAMIVLETPGNELLGHIGESRRRTPSLV